jgi:hypothetical protein
LSVESWVAKGDLWNFFDVPSPYAQITREEAPRRPTVERQSGISPTRQSSSQSIKRIAIWQAFSPRVERSCDGFLGGWKAVKSVSASFLVTPLSN